MECNLKMDLLYSTLKVIMLVFTIEFTVNSYNCFLSLNFLCSPFKIVLEVVKVDLNA